MHRTAVLSGRIRGESATTNHVLATSRAIQDLQRATVVLRVVSLEVAVLDHAVALAHVHGTAIWSGVSSKCTVSNHDVSFVCEDRTTDSGLRLRVEKRSDDTTGEVEALKDGPISSLTLNEDDGLLHSRTGQRCLSEVLRLQSQALAADREPTRECSVREPHG